MQLKDRATKCAKFHPVCELHYPLSGTSDTVAPVCAPRRDLPSLHPRRIPEGSAHQGPLGSGEFAAGDRVLVRRAGEDGKRRVRKGRIFAADPGGGGQMRGHHRRGL